MNNNDPRDPVWLTDPALWEKLKPLARQMRQAPTEAEAFMWEHLRNRQILGLKFRRQHSIERFIADFYCAEANLIVEIDGSVHEYTQIEDGIRQKYFESLGIRVIRFTNSQVLKTIDDVIKQVIEAMR